MKFVNIVGATRYLVIIPILGLAIAAAAMFAFGGLGLIVLVIRSIGESSSGHGAVILPIFGLLEFVHQFLIGTVLYITAMGLFQLFIQDVPLPQWMKTESAEDLETNLVGVTVVVLAIEFLGAVFSGRQENLLTYGAGVALPIAALALFLGAKHLAHPKRPAAAPQVESSLAGRKEVAAHAELDPKVTRIRSRLPACLLEAGPSSKGVASCWTLSSPRPFTSWSLRSSSSSSVS